MKNENNEMFDKFMSMIVDVIAEQVKEKVKDINISGEDGKLTYRPKEVMELLDIGSNAMYEVLLKDDTFPKFFIGKNAYIPKDELREWVNDQAKKGRKIGTRA